MATFGEPGGLAGRVQEEVAGGIGVVTVDLDGRLVAVEFDPNRLYLLDERRLGPQLVAAVAAAEANAKHARRALLNTSGEHSDDRTANIMGK